VCYDRQAAEDIEDRPFGIISNLRHFYPDRSTAFSSALRQWM
jgi:hypothetical protein